MSQTVTENTPAAMSAATADNVVEIEDLYVHFRTRLGVVRAVNGVSLRIPRGGVMGVVGESGCGKSIMALAVMQLVPPPGEIVRGRITLRPGGRAPIDVLEHGRNSPEMRAIRGDYIGMIFQEPMTSLNPCYTVGDQIAEGILLHQTPDKAEAWRRTLDIIDRVGLPKPAELARRYPHELSGGMRQRAMIALALSCRPDLLIADEPTTAIDVTTQAQILDVMRELQQSSGMSILFITHNLGVIAQMADNVAVMYLGQIVERAPVKEIFGAPQHPYTRALLDSIPLFGSRQKKRLRVIAGSVPGSYTQVPGCPFHPRCPHAMRGVCNVLSPALQPLGGGGTEVSCFLHHPPVEVARAAA